ncbi:MAG: hypothetical protein K2J60_18705 [Acetatifactor sp.]|nr:hypothetical protein [Acetatifactor sp.]
MKKKIIALLLTVTTVISLAACGKSFTCDICGKEKTGKQFKMTILGEEVIYCSDCAETTMDDINSWLK